MGTPETGKKAAETNKKKYGADYYRRIAPLSQAAWRENGCKRRGFSALTPERRREIAQQGRQKQLKDKENGAS